MNSSFEVVDYLVFLTYALIILTVGLWVSRNKDGKQKNAEDYFLASKSLPWWAIGASLIAANISAEQFIGMSGSGFALGLAIASYEWMAAITLIIVGKYFLPIFIEKGLYTIPEFVEKRFSTNLKSILAVFWICLYVFVNLASVLYLGALALETIMDIPMMYGVLGLALFSAAYSLYGGLSAVAWTDVIQVIFLILGGLVTTYLALNAISDGQGMITGLKQIYRAAPDRFVMILDKSNPEYKNLPGIGVLVGGMWVANLYYWGFNQYIIQRTLAAKSLKESQKGILMAAVLKLIIPLIVVIPGIAAMLNSTSTIFTMDIYKQYLRPHAGDKETVNMGRISAAIALLIAGVMAPLLGSIDQAFQFIQEYTGIVSPGILAVFILGLFWKKTTNKAAIIGALTSIPIAMYFKVAPKGWLNSPLFIDVPFLDQMAYTSLLTMLVIVLVSYFQLKGNDDEKAINISKETFITSPVFNISSFAIILTLVALYSFFWS